MSNLPPGNSNLLFRKWPATGLAEAVAEVDRQALCDEYGELKRCAPRRSSTGKSYFVEGHCGVLSKKTRSNRFEEHLAMVLWNLRGYWPCLDRGGFRLLDYQFPLKARQSDRGIGKIDLLGVTGQGRLMIIELKVKPPDKNGRGDSPVSAMMQGLRYAAIVEANRTAISKEAKERFDVKIVDDVPVVQILAPKAWWYGWLELERSTRKTAGCWEREFLKLARDVEKQLGVAIQCVALDDLDRAGIDYGSDGGTPQIDRAPALYPVRPCEVPAIGSALPAHRPAL